MTDGPGFNQDFSGKLSMSGYITILRLNYAHNTYIFYAYLDYRK